MTDTVRALSELFDGYDKAHGRFTAQRVSEKGKTEGRATTHREPPSLAQWEAHVAGTGPGIGIIPLRSDNTMAWGCIDIDVIGIKHAELEAKCVKLGLPLVVCRSKSGGAHAFVFLATPVEARIVVPILESWAAALGYGGCEIFPKQTSRYDEVNDVGNWLNMPYYHADLTSRYCVRDGQPLELPDFLEFAAVRTITPDLLKAAEAAARPTDASLALFEEGPPCLQTLHTLGGFDDGTRNEGLFNVAVYLKKRYENGWADKLNEYNAEMCTPALPASDITAMSKSVQNKDYEYKCRKAPINAHCDRTLCATREFGISDNIPAIKLTKLDGDPVEWLFEINGKRLMVDTHELTTQKLFQEKVASAIQRYPRTLKQPDWERKLDDWIRKADVQVIEVEDTESGLTRQTIEKYLTGQARCIRREDFGKTNNPYHSIEDDEIYFNLAGVLKYLHSQGIRVKNTTRLTTLFREMGCVKASSRIIPGQEPIRHWRVKAATLSRRREDDVFANVEFGTSEF